MKPTMLFRLTNDTGFSLTLGSDDPKRNKELFKKAYRLVSAEFKTVPGAQNLTGMTPEILSEETTDKIAEMEDLLEEMRALLLEAETQDRPEVTEVLNAVDRLLGYPNLEGRQRIIASS